MPRERHVDQNGQRWCSGLRVWKELNKQDPVSSLENVQSDSRLRKLMRRLMAMVYDVFLVTAVMFAISAIAVAINGGASVDSPLYYGVLLLVPCCFYLWFWLHGGQTLGMSAWKIRLTDSDLTPVTARQCLLRMLFAVITLAPCGLGLLWMLIDSDGRTLYGRFSGTRISRYERK